MAKSGWLRNYENEALLGFSLPSELPGETLTNNLRTANVNPAHSV
jgi:hypothetical protein